MFASIHSMLDRALRHVPSRPVVTMAMATFFSVTTSTAADSQHWTIIRAGTLLAVPGTSPETNRSIVIRNDKIADVRAGFISARDLPESSGEPVAIIDLSNKFVLPGLIDCHVHLTEYINDRFQLETVTRSPSDRAIDGVLYASRTLMAGFTTVRDMGAEPEAIFALGNGILAGKVPGPRIVAAGAALSPTGGHADPSNGYRLDLPFPRSIDAICDGADACREETRRQVKLGADVIKIMATGGVLDDSRSGLDQQFTDAELQAIVEAAHLLGRKVAAHAHGPNGIRAALRAGVDSIEHGTLIDDDGLKLMRSTGAYLVPTLLALSTVAANVEKTGYYPDAVREKARTILRLAGERFKAAHKAGVKIAFGTDSGVSEHGRNAEEFALLVRAGLSPMDAIRAATVSAADLLGLADKIGSLRPGMVADIVAVDRSPLEDITELLRVRFVMKGGIVYKGGASDTPRP